MASNNTPNTAVYAPLSRSKDIRLIEIVPAEQYASELICELRTYEFRDDTVLDFEALSWCWGDKKEVKRISVQTREHGEPARPIRAHSFIVRKSLFGALKALRLRDAGRLLWVDAICINQDDAFERNQQVSRMSELYGRASNVCIWLGEEEAESTAAMQFIKQKLSLPYMLRRHTEDKDLLPHWLALKDIMKRSWFTRRWIVQEVALARKATVHCGNETIDWADFRSAVSIFVQSKGTLETLAAVARRDSSLPDRKANIDEVVYSGAAKLVDISNRLFKRDAGGVLHRTSRLENLVAWLPMFESGEPKDIIYALLALAKDTRPATNDVPDIVHGRRLTDGEKKTLQKIRKLLPSVSVESFPIEYQAPTLDVYQRFMIFAIKRSDPARALDIICRPFAMAYKTKETGDPTLPEPASNENGYELPSWMPELSSLSAFERQPLPDHGDGTFEPYRYTRARGDLFVSSPETVSYYSAADGKHYNPLKLKFRRRQSHYSMFVEGFVLDEIEQIEETSRFGVVTPEWMRLGLQSGDGMQSFIRTLLADRGPAGVSPAFYNATLGATLKRFAANNNTLNTEREMKDTDSSQVKEVMQHLINTISGRKMIKTKHLSCLGLAPARAEQGDLVCISYGCSVPVILRRHTEPKNHAMDDEADLEDLTQRRAQAIKLLRNWLTRPRATLTVEQAKLRAERLDLALLAAGEEANTSTPSHDFSPTSASGVATSAITQSPTDIQPPAQVPGLRHRTVSQPAAQSTHAGQLVAEPGELSRRHTASSALETASVSDTDQAHAAEAGRAITIAVLAYHVVLETIATRIVLFRATLFSLVLWTLTRYLHEPILGWAFIMLAMSHYTHAVLAMSNRRAILKRLTYLAPLLLVPWSAGIIYFITSTLVWVFAVCLYPQLFPQQWMASMRRLLAAVQHRQVKALKDITDNSETAAALASTISRVSAAATRRPRTLRTSTIQLPRPETADDWRARHNMVLSRTQDAGFTRENTLINQHAFELIGESYIDGMMTGEAIKKQNDSVGEASGGRMYPVMFEIR